MTYKKIAAGTLAAGLVVLGGAGTASAHGGHQQNNGRGGHTAVAQHDGGRGNSNGSNFRFNFDGRTNTAADSAGTDTKNKDCWHGRYNGYSHNANWDQQYEARLQVAVDEGKLTTEQRDAVVTQHKQLIDFSRAHPNFHGSDHDAWVVEIDTLQAWSNANNISLSWLF